MKRIPNEDPQIIFYLIKNYTANTSVIIMKSQHALLDGLGISMCGGEMTDIFDV